MAEIQGELMEQMTLRDLVRVVMKKEGEVGDLPVIYLAGALQALLQGIQSKDSQLQSTLAHTQSLLSAPPYWTSDRLLALDKLRQLRPYPMTPLLKPRVEQLAQTFGTHAEVRYNRTGRWLRGVTITEQFPALPAEYEYGDVKVVVTGTRKTILLLDEAQVREGY